MVQEGAESYDELIALLEDRLGTPLAAQIRDEVARGRLVQGSQLPEHQERQSRLAQAKLARIRNDEMAELLYTGDERLALLCQALLTLAQTMTETRRALLSLAREVRFAEPDGTEVVGFDLNDELAKAEQALSQVSSLLEPVRQEVGVWH